MKYLITAKPDKGSYTDLDGVEMEIDVVVGSIYADSKEEALAKYLPLLQDDHKANSDEPKGEDLFLETKFTVYQLSE